MSGSNLVAIVVQYSLQINTAVNRVRNDLVYDTVHRLVVPVIAEYPDYLPEDDGYLVSIEPDDVRRHLEEHLDL